MKGKNGMKECPNCKELVGDNVRVCFHCNYDFLLKKVIDQSAERKRREEEEQRIRDAQERQRKESEAESKIKGSAINTKAEQISKNPVYEYATVVVNDDENGRIDVDYLNNILNEYASAGWKLHSILTNEIGKNRTSSSVTTVMTVTTGTNATVEQTIMIFERCIKAEER